MRSDTIYEKNKFWFKLKLSFSIVLTWWIVSFLSNILNFSIRGFGLRPHNLDSLINIFTYPFVHGDLEHLSSNSLSGFILFATMFVMYEKYSIKVLTILYIFSGLLLWFIGLDGSLHVGASSIIYGVGFFIFFSGMIIRDNANVAIGLFMVAWYGSMIWGISPYTTQANISWEGHLSGAVIGIILAFWFHRKSIIQRKSIIENEAIEEDFYFFEKYPLEENEDYEL